MASAPPLPRLIFGTAEEEAAALWCDVLPAGEAWEDEGEGWAACDAWDLEEAPPPEPVVEEGEEESVEEAAATAENGSEIDGGNGDEGGESERGGESGDDGANWEALEEEDAIIEVRDDSPSPDPAPAAAATNLAPHNDPASSDDDENPTCNGKSWQQVQQDLATTQAAEEVNLKKVREAIGENQPPALLSKMFSTARMSIAQQQQAEPKAYEESVQYAEQQKFQRQEEERRRDEDAMQRLHAEQQWMAQQQQQQQRNVLPPSSTAPPPPGLNWQQEMLNAALGQTWQQQDQQQPMQPMQQLQQMQQQNWRQEINTTLGQNWQQYDQRQPIQQQWQQPAFQTSPPPLASPPPQQQFGSPMRQHQHHK